MRLEITNDLETYTIASDVTAQEASAIVKGYDEAYAKNPDIWWAVFEAWDFYLYDAQGQVYYMEVMDDDIHWFNLETLEELA